MDNAAWFVAALRRTAGKLRATGKPEYVDGMTVLELLADEIEDGAAEEDLKNAKTPWSPVRTWDPETRKFYRAPFGQTPTPAPLPGTSPAPGKTTAK